MVKYMSKLDELIKKYCPDGVEYKNLHDICEIRGRIGFRGYTKQDVVAEGEGAISLSPSNILNGEISFNKCTYISWSKYEESPEIKAEINDILFCKTASVGKTALIKKLPKEATINPQLVILKNISCNASYLSYVLKTNFFQEKINKIKGLGTVPTISQKELSLLSIPVPPLPIQEEIVRILDSFTSLTAELQDKLNTELQARKKQYEYYKHHLLHRSDKVVELASVAYYVKERINANMVDKTTYVGVDNLLQNCEGKVISNHVPTDGKLIKYMPNDILIGNIRPYLRKIWFADNIGGTNGDVLTIRLNDNSGTEPKYLYHVLSSDDFFIYDTNNAKGAKMPRGNKDAVMKYKFSVPTLLEQRKIADILEHFYAICNDITTGLPAEIAARQKQYEYYRDKLLTFKELS